MRLQHADPALIGFYLMGTQKRAGPGQVVVTRTAGSSTIWYRSQAARTEGLRWSHSLADPENSSSFRLSFARRNPSSLLPRVRQCEIRSSSGPVHTCPYFRDFKLTGSIFETASSVSVPLTPSGAVREEEPSRSETKSSCTVQTLPMQQRHYRNTASLVTALRELTSTTAVMMPCDPGSCAVSCLQLINFGFMCHVHHKR